MEKVSYRMDSGPPRGLVKSPRIGDKSSINQNRHSRPSRYLLKVFAENYSLGEESDSMPSQITIQIDILKNLLQARMLLREMVEYQHEADGRFDAAKLKKLVSLHSAIKDDDGIWAEETRSIQNAILKLLHSNRNLEKELQEMETRIALLIQNRNAIQKVSRPVNMIEFKKKVESQESEEPKIDLEQDPKMMDFTSNLFHLIQTTPKILFRMLRLLQQETASPFWKNLVATLFGKPFNKREEFWFLQLISVAAEEEIAVKKSKIAEDISDGESMLYGLTWMFCRRHEAEKFASTVLEDWIVEISELKLRLGPVSAATKQRGIMELLNQRSKVEKRDSQQALASSEASEAQSTKSMGDTSEAKRLKTIRKYTRRLLIALRRNLREFPYGLRFICRQIRNSMQSRRLTEQSVNRTMAMLIFDGFISPYLCQYDEKQIMDGLRIGRNFPVLHNVLGKIFSYTSFSADSKYAPLNDWLSKMQTELSDWLQDVTEVHDADVHLGFDEADEQLTMEKPFVFIDSQDMAYWARFFLEHGSHIIEEDDMEERARTNVLAQLSNRIPKPHRVVKKEINLELMSNIVKDAEVIAAQDTESLLYDETRALTASIFREVVLEIGRTYTLHQILDCAAAQKDYLETRVRKVRKNLKELEASGRIDPAKNYAKFVRDVASEITHHRILLQERENRLARLQSTLQKLGRFRAKLEKRQEEYNKYHGLCRDNAARKKDKAAGKKKSYELKSWLKAGILLPESSGMPYAKDTKFKLRMPEVGIFELEVKVDGKPQGSGRVKLDDLLELRKEGGTAVCNIYEFNPEKLLKLLNQDFLK